MKIIILIIACFLLSTAFVKANFVMHSYAKDAALTKTELKQSQKPTKKIIDSLQYNQLNRKKEDYYTKRLSPETRAVFEKSVARQLKAKNKLNEFSCAGINDKKSIDNFTKENVGVFINAFIEAVDFCIPTNKYSGLKDLRSADVSIKHEVGNVEYTVSDLINKYPEECWEYFKPQIFTYDNNFNFRTNPAPIKVIRGIVNFNKFIINKLNNDEHFFKEFRKYYIYYDKINLSFGMSQPLYETYKHKSTPELELLLEEDWNENYFDGWISLVLSGRNTEEAYCLYEKYMNKKIASLDPKKESYKKYVSSVKYRLKEFRKRVDKHERLRKEAEKGKSEEQVFAEYTADLKQREKELEKMNLDSEGAIRIYFAQLKNAQVLTDKYPKGHHYFSTKKSVQKIIREAKPELKEVYWKYMNEKQNDEFDQIIAGSSGAAFGEVMAEEDLPRAFDYMNKQRSFKLIDLLSFYKDTPPLAHKAASMAMLQHILLRKQTNMVEYFVKNHKKIKDPDIRRHLLEIAPRYGLTNYPEPFYP